MVDTNYKDVANMAVITNIVVPITVSSNVHCHLRLFCQNILFLQTHRQTNTRTCVMVDTTDMDIANIVVVANIIVPPTLCGVLCGGVVRVSDFFSKSDS